MKVGDLVRVYAVELFVLLKGLAQVPWLSAYKVTRKLHWILITWSRYW